MSDTETQQWAFIFHVLGKENLRKMLFKAAMKKEEDGRVIVEFDGERAMDITKHVDTLEEGDASRTDQ
jgi:hypothetical protein